MGAKISTCVISFPVAARFTNRADAFGEGIIRLELIYKAYCFCFQSDFLQIKLLCLDIFDTKNVEACKLQTIQQKYMLARPVCFA